MPIETVAGSAQENSARHHDRRPTYPFRLSHRTKPRRWPLVLRFIKGAIHGAILLPVLGHAIFTVIVVILDKHVFDTVGVPPTIIPSLSIVVGLILVFRNQTSYNRFWDGRNCLTTITTALRNLTRAILVSSRNPNGPLSDAEKQDIERTIRLLIAFPYAVKCYLRAEWSTEWGAISNPNMIADVVRRQEAGGPKQEFLSLLPAGFQAHEADGLGLPLQLTFPIDAFIQRGAERGWYDPPTANQMGNQVSAMIDAYGKMETIKLTPIPVAHLIHQKQVLALFGCVLPFAMVDDMGWWAVPIVCLVIFTLYGIEGIGSQLEDPFGYDKNDIKMDAIVEDERVEIEAILNEWKKLNDLPIDGDGSATNGARNGTRNGTSNGIRNGTHNGTHNGVTNGNVAPREMFIRS
ncbi:hypothetical protein H112_00168 [Trichophyton rubrum D6]|uniref:Uncharacterized protein n=4 Tax=Trichophyton TaxID=5550 RepID=A0A178FAR6_TRIRU|nr:uncharacterized protein TERG_08487 [Trichophyton rubrum CBS 118892]EZF27920.1 hypothetical protein H100_00168 [Trichophyton rubrum MR850]EZF46926.1 hypothetical protein H102_00167 [Trichophyton rubrum CBS 100081]EZF57640.1 hypothetical protein H103_00169 [Trichophyton rubrum CBS 288.86]EZF68204.1 hypothetical protein H104_00168 [Trichophyton rubrum CBS 289.86]EZF78912.1 hypothetical protein H105_00159 [Trichophyton soudanense CBS 452.61]EZF89489.1 hypothetical protein H110_00168 [Trichophy